MSMRQLAIALSTLLLTTAVAWAEETQPERWFQVEVLIFTNPEREIDNPEVWPSFASITTPKKFINLTAMEQDETIELTAAELADLNAEQIEMGVSAVGLVPFEVLSVYERQLTDQRQRLERARGHRILFHQAWNQPVPNRDNVIPIRINGGEKYGRQAELQGFVELYVERFLHLRTDLHLLEYQVSQDPFSLVAQEGLPAFSLGLESYGGLSLLNTESPLNTRIARTDAQFYVAKSSAALRELRRMRSQEIHYLDNPKFGMMILITPLTIGSN